MTQREFPLKVEEVIEEEVASFAIRRTSNINRYVRCSPGGVLLPYSFAHLSNHFYNFEFRSDDVLVSTFPKSGTVWTAEIVWAMTHFDQIHTMDTTHIKSRNFFLDMDFIHPPNPEDETPLLKTFRDVCPEGRIEDGLMLQLAKAQKGRRILKTHLQLQFLNPELLNTSKVVYVVRNPKDTIVSLYYFMKQREDVIVHGDFPALVENFMEDKVNYTPYWAHLQQAWNLIDHPNFHFVFYEDMKDDIMKELRRLNDFLSLGLTPDRLEIVADATNFKNMKERDLKLPMINMDGSFFRKGIVGDWKNMASVELDAKMDRWIEENSKNIGIKFKYS